MKYFNKKNLYKNTLDENILNTFFQSQQTLNLASILREEIYELSKDQNLCVKNQLIIRSTLKNLSRYIQTLSVASTPIYTELDNRNIIPAEHKNKAPKIQDSVYSAHNNSQEHIHACIKLIENIDSMEYRLNSTYLTESSELLKKSLQNYINTAGTRKKLLDNILQKEEPNM